MSNRDKPNVVTTRWWWVRHAPVREDGGCIYGQKDLGCDTSDLGYPPEGAVATIFLQSAPPARTVVPHAPRPPRRSPQPLPSQRAGDGAATRHQRALTPGREYYRRWWFRPPLGPRAELQAHRSCSCDPRRVFPARRERTPGVREGLPCALSNREHCRHKHRRHEHRRRAPCRRGHCRRGRACAT